MENGTSNFRNLLWLVKAQCPRHFSHRAWFSRVLKLSDEKSPQTASLADLIRKPISSRFSWRERRNLLRYLHLAACMGAMRQTLACQKTRPPPPALVKWCC